MTNMTKPDTRPANPNFSSGPCAKRPGWSPAVLNDALVGRSHRSKPGKAKIQEVIDKTRSILGIPEDYRIGIVAGSDTGAVEMALWSMLGARGVDMLQWESFGKGWVGDVNNQLKLDDVRRHQGAVGQVGVGLAVDQWEDGLDSMGVEIDIAGTVGHVGHNLQPSPQTGGPAHRDGMTAEIECFGGRSRVQHRDVHVGEGARR